MNSVPALVAHLFRHQYGQLSATLTRILGVGRIDLVEEVVQETLLRALKHWSHGEIPENPPAWMMQTAKNLALDIVRRDRAWQSRAPEVTAHFESLLNELSPDSGVWYHNQFDDDMLRMLFACAHPSLSDDSQVVFALKTLCGFSVEEIAHAFLLDGPTIAQRITRAKKKLRESDISLETPPAEVIKNRLENVLRMLYLLFSEGYSSYGGDEVIRRDLCHEAIRLATILAKRLASHRQIHALLALMFFQVSRFDSRVSVSGDLLLLEEQNRQKWDVDCIAQGFTCLEKSLGGETLSRYHIEAAIAAEHVKAVSYQTTNWARVLGLYDDLLNIDPSPIVCLNRAVALSMVDGPDAAMRALDKIANVPGFQTYALYHATLAELYRRLGDMTGMAASAATAISLTTNEATRKLFERRFNPGVSSALLK